MSEKATRQEKEKRLPETVKKIMAILEEDGYMVGDLERIFEEVKQAANETRITLS